MKYANVSGMRYKLYYIKYFSVTYLVNTADVTHTADFMDVINIRNIPYSLYF